MRNTSHSSDAADGTEFFSFALPDAEPRRTRIALAEACRPRQAPSEASAHRSRAVERELRERQQARCILSYFLINQLYPGIRYKKVWRGFQVGAAEKIKSKTTQEAGQSKTETSFTRGLEFLVGRKN